MRKTSHLGGSVSRISDEIIGYVSSQLVGLQRRLSSGRFVFHRSVAIEQIDLETSMAEIMKFECPWHATWFA